MKKNHK